MVKNNHASFYLEQAKESDLDTIMYIEQACFLEGIRETKETFSQRLLTFPKGFYLLKRIAQDQKDNPTNKIETIGYFTSEIWTNLSSDPAQDFALNHSAQKRHTEEGIILYVSSFAVHPLAQGGAGRFLFSQSIQKIVTSFPHIQQIIFIVNETWLAARHIYETEGFTYLASLSHFFKGPNSKTNALIMSCTTKDFINRKKGITKGDL